MATVHQVDKQAKLDLWNTVRFQLLTHSYLTNKDLSNSELDCLTLLGITGESDLTEFCNLASEKKIFKTTQTVRNCLVKMEKAGFIVKQGRNKKKICITPSLQLQAQGNILLNFKFIHLASTQS